jgi:hypothetical protein
VADNTNFLGESECIICDLDQHCLASINRLKRPVPDLIAMGYHTLASLSTRWDGVIDVETSIVFDFPTSELFTLRILLKRLSNTPNDHRAHCPSSLLRITMSQSIVVLRLSTNMLLQLEVNVDNILLNMWVTFGRSF